MSSAALEAAMAGMETARAAFEAEARCSPSFLVFAGQPTS